MSRIAILVTGGRGQLGSDLTAAAAKLGMLYAPRSNELDITDITSIQTWVDIFVTLAKDSSLTPVVINAAGYTAVDTAETETVKAFEINAVGARNLAIVCARYGLPLIHVSTDYVFPGTASNPYEPDDRTDPKTVYGKSKLLGEQHVLAANDLSVIVRTAWLYGASGHNFVKTMARLERNQDILSVVDDQIGCPTWSADLAVGLLQLAQVLADGRPLDRRIMHCVSAGQTTWCGLAKAVFTELGADPERIKPCTTAEYPLPAPRPAYSVLSTASWQATGLTPPRHWREALAAAVLSGSFGH